MRKWGQQPESWPADILAALKYFRAIDLLDLEQHIVVAASRIGIAPSLKQISQQEGDVNALDALRHMATARRRDFRL